MKHLLWFAVFAGLACTPAAAQAQFFARGGLIRPIYTGGYGSGGYSGGFGYTGGYGYGGYNYGGVGIPYYSGAYPPIFDYMPPTYTVTTIPLGNFGPSLTQSYAPVAPYSSYGYTEGSSYSASTGAAPRMRASLYPAIPVRDTPLDFVPATAPETAPERLPKPATVDSTRARIQIQVPKADAKLYFDGELTKQTGLIREYNTPPLESGYDYSFRIRVTWTDALDQPLQKTWTIRVRAGDTLRDSFKDH